MRVAFKVEGLALTIALLDRLDLDDTTDLMQLVGQTVKLQTVERFATEVDPDGAAWRPLAASTIARKGSSGILKDTGALMGSIAVRASPKQAEIGPTVFYGVFHQFGGHRGGWPHGCPPKRSFLGLNAENMAEIEQIVESYLASKLG